MSSDNVESSLLVASVTVLSGVVNVWSCASFDVEDDVGDVSSDLVPPLSYVSTVIVGAAVAPFPVPSM